MMHRRSSLKTSTGFGAENAPPPPVNMMPLSPKANFQNDANVNGHNTNIVHSHLPQHATKQGNVNVNHGNHDHNNNNEQIFQLQIEIQSLKQRLKLASGASKNELLAVLSEKETVIQSKSKQITTLNEKFHKITKAVGRMEKEVSILRKDNEEYEQDNKKLKRHLNIREKEVTALVQRCTLQEEKLGESKSARVLERQLVDMKQVLEKSREKLKDMESLQQSLDVTRREKDMVTEQLEVLTRDRDTLSATLQDTKERLEKELQEKDEAWRDCQQTKERLEADCARLNATLNECNIRMSDMNKNMQDLRNANDDRVKDMESQIAEKTEQAQTEKDQHGLALAQLRAEQQEQTRDLQSQLKTREDELAKECKHSNVIREELDKANTTLEEMQLERDDLAVARDEDVKRHAEEMDKMTQAADAKSQEIETLEGLVKELGDQRSRSDEDVTAMSEKIATLEAEVEDARGRVEAMKDTDKTNADTILKLETEMQVMGENAQDMEEEYKEKLAAMEEAQTVMKDEYEGMLLESEEQLKEMDAQFEAERNKVENLRNEIDQMTVHSERQEQLRQMEMKLLEESVTAAKMNTDVKERELNSKLAELRHERDRAAELEASFKVLEKASSQADTSSAAIVDELKRSVQEGTIKYAKLEEERDTIITESRKAVDGLKSKITDLDEEFTNLKAEIVSKDTQLEQRQTTIDSLVKAKGELESKILSYRNDLELLMKAYDGTKEEYTRAVRSLEEDKKHLKKERDDDFQSFKNDYQQLQTLASESQDEIDQLQASNQSLKEMLEEKEMIINGTDNFKKDLQKKNEEKDSVIKDLQIKLELRSAETEEIKKRSAQFRMEKEREVFQHLDAVDSERAAREALEAKVQKLEEELEEKKREYKTASELKAANFLLQDKIDRQEAYLKRKLQKEKVMKDRMKPLPSPAPPLPSGIMSPTRGKPRKSLSESKIPMRSPPTRSRSLTRRPVDTQKAYVARTRSSSIGIRKAPSEDELDQILNGDTV